ncbi:MAG: 23S rRNA (cytidine(2498)-2'-O)-methyltransferase RlmM [Myxococcales bacterium]
MSVLLHCRSGFEKECAAEVQAAAQSLGVPGYAKARPNEALVQFVPADPASLPALESGLRLDALVFARQVLFGVSLVDGLPQGDRVGPLVERARQSGRTFAGVEVETADTDAAKELSTLCRKLTPPLAAAAKKAALVAGAETADAPRLTAVFIGPTAAYVGWTVPGNRSEWPMGIPRLKFPPGAPSRSTLKLAEAIVTFFPEDAQRRARLKAGMRAVDLGASPGGWTYQLVDRGMHVTAVDNGSMDPALMATGLVDHVHADGFRYRPEQSVDWMVCDMVEQPSRVAALVARWIGEGDCKASVFNWKLPMKKRLDEVVRCREIVEAAARKVGPRLRVRVKQLFHDREEVTGYVGE